MNAFADRVASTKESAMYRSALKTLQVNLGNLCNQTCRHCHVGAGPEGTEIMTKETVDDVIGFLFRGKGLALDITGGAPEMNPNFRYLVEKARPFVREIIVRSNLTVLLEPGQEDTLGFLKENKVRVVGSLPCYTEENVDRQRGQGVFVKSMEALKRLNSIGYGKDPELVLDLAYNPGGAYLPAPQASLESDYKKKLKEEQGIAFKGLVAITNAPISRFRDQLEEEGGYDSYMELLEGSFNENILDGIMCRTILSVGWDGSVYDCDFNQAESMDLKDSAGNKLRIGELSPGDMDGRKISFKKHCFCCTAGAGSSCQGAIEDDCDETRAMVSEYYGDVLAGSKDLKTSACCSIEDVPEHVRKITAKIAPEILERFYGCGSPIPAELKGMSALDLGCGTGKDAYVIACLAGEEGHVLGIDMTQQQLDIAEKHLTGQMDRFGFVKPNVEFKKGYIEDLRAAGVEDGTFDVVVSNCVVNLSARKDRVLSEVYRVLKEGGEFFFSDVFVDRRLPAWMKEDSVLLGECLGAALYWKDFETLAAEAGFRDVRVYSRKPITIDGSEVKKKVGDAVFTSVTYRMFRIKEMESSCEDFRQHAKYLGGIEFSDGTFRLDEQRVFSRGEKLPVCGNTALILKQSRFGRYFQITGDMKVHYGPFPGCDTGPILSDDADPCGAGTGCCC